MAEIENPVITTQAFIESWKTQDPNRLTAELISLNKETNRKPDNYYFEVEDNLLIDPETKRPVLDFIAPGPEYDIAENLQTWASEGSEGLAYWVSPRLEGKYPCEKIIIHRIAYTFEGKKVVSNSAILFDANLGNTEELRKTLFTTEDSEENIFKILSWVESVSDKKVDYSENSQDIRTRASYFAAKIKTGVPKDLIIAEMQQTGFLGKNPISCPSGQSFSGYIDSRAFVFIYGGGEDQYGPLIFNCPKCKESNARQYGQLIPNCLHCGADVTC